MYFGRGGEEGDQLGMLSETERAIFGRSYAAEPDVLIAQLKTDEAIAEAGGPQWPKNSIMANYVPFRRAVVSC